MTESPAYRHFSSLYDDLMADAPYDEWLKFLFRKATQYNISGKQLLDIGCGTGTLAIQLAEAGYRVTGVDLSDDMLAVAANKAMENQQSVTFIEQDMRELQLGQRFHIITAFCDVINYLNSMEDMVRSFTSIYEHLEDEGLFLFDVHSVYKMAHIFCDASFCSADDELSYIWECFDGPYEHSVVHELSFFLQEATGLYRRFDESHEQRTFEKEEYIHALETAGFTCLSVEGDFKEGQPEDHAERLFFTAKKK